MLQQVARQVAPASWKPRARHLAQAALPESLVLLALLLLLADCSVKAAGAVVEALRALVVQAVRAVVALVAVAARVAAAHTQPALAALVAMAGHWYWSSEHEALCRG